MRSGTALALALLALLILAPATQASSHLIKVREVYPGSTTNPDAEFIELQMYAAGQTQVGGRAIALYDPTGFLEVSGEFPADVANGEEQSTILITTFDALAVFPLSPDLIMSDNHVFPAGGAVCLEDVDCVAWGADFPPSSMLPSPFGAPAPAIPDGSSLTRSIAPGCPTMLEGTDDTNDSTTDFGFAAPTPRPNSVAPTEIECPGGDLNPPNTKIRKGPKGKVEQTTVRFRFRSDEPSSTFECRLDRKEFRPCESPKELRRLGDGGHRFRVRATDASGNTDPTPAKRRFKVVG